MKILRVVTLSCTILIAPAITYAKNSVLLISTPNEAFLFPEVLSKVKQAYKQVGYKVKFEKLPAGRSIIESNRLDIYDAELARVKETETKLPNHIRIDEPIMNMHVKTYSLGKSFELKQWSELEGKEICSVKGLIALEKILSPYNPVLVSRANQCIEMIKKLRVELAILPDSLAMTHNGSVINVDIKTGNTPLSNIQLYHFINKKHHKLVTPLTGAFKQLNEKGLSN